MDNYRDILERVIQKEVTASVIIGAVLALIVGIVWFCHCFHFHTMKIKKPKQYNSQQQTKNRRKSMWASIGMTLVCVCLAAVVAFGTVETVSDIYQDIEENAYASFTGEYYVDNGHRPRKLLYDRWLSVAFNDSDYALLYIDGLSEWITTETGWFQGTIVYGEHSGIVVSMTRM